MAQNHTGVTLRARLVGTKRVCICIFSRKLATMMIITSENRNDIDKINVHDACFYSFETKLVGEEYCYTFKAYDEWLPEEEFLFVFSGIRSSAYTAERYSYILGSYVNSWYSLPCRQVDSFPPEPFTEDEIRELHQHYSYKGNSLKEDVRYWGREYKSRSKKNESLFKIVFFLSTPIAFLEIECEELRVEKIPRSC